jgi:hypothetical protein
MVVEPAAAMVTGGLCVWGDHSDARFSKLAPHLGLGRPASLPTFTLFPAQLVEQLLPQPLDRLPIMVEAATGQRPHLVMLDPHLVAGDRLLAHHLLL